MRRYARRVAARRERRPRAGIIGAPMPHSRQPAVVISGIGAVSPYGVGRERYWRHISRGCSGTKAITQFDVSSYPCKVAAWVPPVSVDDAPALEGDDEFEGR